MEAHTAVLTFIAASPLLAYSLLFFGMIVEGDLLIFSAGFLAHRGVLNPLGAFLSIAFGVILGDAAWYWLGRIDTSRNRVLNWLGRMTDVAAERLEKHLKERTIRTLFISKFVYGTHHFTLVCAGRLRVPFWKFVKADALGSVLWITISGTAGYLASAGFAQFKDRLKLVEIALLLAIIGYFAASEIISRLLKKEL